MNRTTKMVLTVSLVVLFGLTGCNENGRYMPAQDGGVLDTRTGTYYVPDRRENVPSCDANFRACWVPMFGFPATTTTETVGLGEDTLSSWDRQMAELRRQSGVPPFMLSSA